jgi:hypothetical protein
MAYLFEITNKIAYPTPEVLLIEPFKSIWERDTTENKHKALEEFAYMEFMTSYKKSNPYRQYPPDMKEKVIMAEIITQENWTPDGLVKTGISKIMEFQDEASTTVAYYLAAKKGAEQMINFFNTLNISSTNEKTGNPIYKPRDITSALNDTQRVLANLKGLEKKVEEELYEEVKTRANKVISPFADPSSLEIM